MADMRYVGGWSRATERKGDMVEQASHEGSVEAIRAQIAQAYELLETGEYEALPNIREEILRLMRQCGKKQPDVPDETLFKDYHACDTAIDRALAADMHKRFGWRYTAESLEKRTPEALDDIVEKLVFRVRPKPGLVARIHESWKRLIMQQHRGGCAPHLFWQEVPPYSQSFEGMGLILDQMVGRGYRSVILPGDTVRFISQEGKRTAYALPGWRWDLPKAVAIAAVLAVQ
jgi:hypothetical protein